MKIKINAGTIVHTISNTDACTKRVASVLEADALKRDTHIVKI